MGDWVHAILQEEGLMGTGDSVERETCMKMSMEVGIVDMWCI